MLTNKQGKILIRLTRQIIEENLEIKPTDPVKEKELADPIFREHKPLFVTLNKNGQLRGCIGSLVSSESIIEAIKRHAVNAAFFDQRFPPVSEDEVPELKISISILTDPERLEYKTVSDLEQKLRPGIDGVILRDPLRGAATFLPQVWSQLPTVAQFLDHLCGKAGLPENSWQNQQLEIQTYQVQYFNEK